MNVLSLLKDEMSSVCVRESRVVCLLLLCFVVFRFAVCEFPFVFCFLFLFFGSRLFGVWLLFWLTVT